MASGTIYGNTSNEYIDSKIEWSSYGSNIDTNTSKVQAKLYYRRNNTGFTTYGTGSFGIKIGDSNITASKTLTISTDWVLALDSGGVSVAHNSDGTKSITISASGSIPSTTLTATNCSSTVTLDTIPRASIITDAPDRYLGSECLISWTPASSSFRYKIKFSLGNWSYTTGVIHPNKTSAYTYTGYTLPKSVGNQFTTSSSSTMTATLYTYSDSSATKQVGSASAKTFKVNLVAPPTLKCYFYAESLKEDLPSDFSGIFIQGLTRLKVDLTQSEAQYGATLKSGYVTVEGKTYQATGSGMADIKTDCLSTSGSVSVSCQVTDSRGNVSCNGSGTGDAPNSIIVHAYSKPKIVKNTGESSIICHRCTAGGDLDSKGTYLRIKATRQYSAMDGRNSSTLEYRIRAVGSDNIYESGTLLNSDRTSPNVVDTILNVGLLTTTSYRVTLVLHDTLGFEDTYVDIIPTDSVTIHLRSGGKGLGVGKYCENDNSIEVAEDWDVHIGGNVTANSVYPQHIGSIGMYNNKNFDELIYHTGYYIGTAAPSSSGCSNYPTDVTGVLEVVSGMVQNSSTLAWWGFAYQTYKAYTGVIYTRSYFIGSGWTAWKKITLT